jgi:hypothetical protein
MGWFEGISLLDSCGEWCNRPPLRDFSGYKGKRYPYVDLRNFDKCEGKTQYPNGSYEVDNTIS